MDKWKCTICGWLYDPAEGDEGNGIKPGTAWESVPADWRCPMCGAMKKWFVKVSNEDEKEGKK